MSAPATPGFWHRLDLFLARLRPHREPLSLLVDAAVVAACWNVTYLFRLGFERWISARPPYDAWVLLGIVAAYLAAGEFPPGSMGPKVSAAVEFVAATGGRAVITSLDRIVDAWRGRAGTEIVT